MTDKDKLDPPRAGLDAAKAAPKLSSKDKREARLAAALRANLKRRKQARKAQD